MSRARILLADDHTLVVQGIRKLLESEFDLVGSVDNGHDLIRMALDRKPDLAIVDISMPRLNGLDGARQLRHVMPEVRIIILTMHDDPVYVTEAFRAGASAYLLKDAVASELVQAIREVLAGRSYVHPRLQWKDDAPAGRAPRRSSARERKVARELTPRQREVLQLVAEGHSSKEIAQLLYITVKTVEFHRTSIMRKLGLRTTAELTKHALRLGITSF